MTENEYKRCNICKNSDGIHCNNIEDPYSYRLLYKVKWKDLRQPFIARGRIETCERFQNFVRLIELKGSRRLKRNLANSA